MNKIDLIQALKDSNNLSKSEAEAVVNLFFDQMADALAQGDRVEIRGLCSFFVKKYGSYIGRNPKTGEKVKHSVKISLAVINNGTIDEEGSATVVGIQNSKEIYRKTISVSNPIGNGQSVYEFPPYTPKLAGNILWTVKLEDGDPDIDEAVSYTTVVP